MLWVSNTLSSLRVSWKFLTCSFMNYGSSQIQRACNGFQQRPLRGVTVCTSLPISSHIPTSPGPLVAILHQSTSPQTFLLAFQILPLPSALQSPHSPHLSLPAHLPTCTSFLYQPLSIYTGPLPFFCTSSLLPSFCLGLSVCVWVCHLNLNLSLPACLPACLPVCSQSTCYLSDRLPTCNCL